MIPKINVVKRLTPEGSKIHGEQVLTDEHYHIEVEDEPDTYTVVLHYIGDDR